MEGTLFVVSPNLEDFGLSSKLAIVARGKVSEKKGESRFLSLRLGPHSKAATFILQGTQASAGLRLKDKDPNLQLLTVTCNGGTGKSKVGQPIPGVWASLAHPEWGPQQFKFYTEDQTIGPAARDDNPLCPTLRIGIDLEADTPLFIMVDQHDVERRITFGGTLMEQVALLSEATSKAFPACLPGSDSLVFIIKHPPMPWLGSGKKALVLEGGVHVLEGGKKGGGPYWGRLAIGSALDACEFVMDGEPSNMRLLLQSNKKCALNYGDKSCGNDVNMWGDPTHPTWNPSSVFGVDGTYGPRVSDPNSIQAQCCLGYHRDESGSTRIKMVKRNDKKRLIFECAEDMQEYLEELLAQRATVLAAAQQLQNDALAACTLERKAQLKHDGFLKFQGGIPRPIVLDAMREINREIGLSSTTTDSFKAKTFANHPAIKNLINQSMAPHICAELLGGSPDFYRNQIGSGQLALRFPGDMCDPGKATCSQSRFNGVSKGWHIDGCASDFIPGTTDHYGEIHNFSVLLGCLLSDVPEEMSGEVCMFPGSHTALAAYLKEGTNMKELTKQGNKRLPHDKTNDLFTRPIMHGTGKAGDLFIANYMTAHFIAPNTSPFIRYAVYFRVKGPRFLAGKHKNGTRPESMLDPWCDWQSLDTVVEGEGETKEQVLNAPDSLTQEELLAKHEMDSHLATADYSHLQAHA